MDDDDLDIMDSDDLLEGNDDDDDGDDADALDDQAYDGGDGFMDVMSEKNKKKDYEVDFTVFTVDDVAGMMKKDNQQLANLLGLSEEDAFALLRHFQWKQDRLIEMYMDNSDAILAKAGLKSATANAPVGITVEPVFTCDLCINDEPNQRVVTLSCGHQYCASCYANYVKTRVTMESESRILCMAAKCSLLLPESIIRELSTPDILARLRRLQQDNFMRDHEHLKWCPTPRCEHVVECHVPSSQLRRIVPTVICHCKTAFCFGCSLKDHQPAICDIAKRWLKKCADDSETANWIHVNTKECPKCHATIEKNGGCNHMSCKKCKHEFCWVCQGPWSEHGSSWYSCNRFDDKSSEDARGQQAKSRQALERYLHYFQRYDNHDRSAKLERELLVKIEKKMTIMQETTDLSWIEVQFLKRAADTLFQCRMTLKWTYAFAYYLKSSNQTHIFEDNQRDLEMAVENLSGLLEQPIERDTIPQLRQQVLDKTVYVASLREVLLSDSAQGLMEDRWQYNEDITKTPSK